MMGAKSYIWKLPDTLPSHSREVAKDHGPDMQRWQTRVETEYPHLVAHLIWDRDRLAALEQAVDQVMADTDGIAGKDLLRQSLLNRLTGLGLLDTLLIDDRNTEIMVNGPHAVFCEQQGHIIAVDLQFNDADEVALLAQRLAHRAGRELTTEHPWCDAQLGDGSRIHCVLPPISEQPVLTIRRAPRQPLEVMDYLDGGAMSLELWNDLKRWVGLRRNLLVAGGAGTGKTSLLRLLAEQCGSDERLITIEDVRELNLRHPHVVSLESYRQHTLHTLMLNALRMRPDRIIVGEVRGDEALELVEAMQTGHPGSLSTVHSQAPDMRTIYRLARMCAKGSAGIPFDALVEQMTATIDIIVYMKRYADGSRRIDAVTQVRPSGLVPLWKYDGSSFIKIGEYVDG